MPLNDEEKKILIKYIASVSKIINKYIPDTVPGNKNYFKLVEYARCRAQVIVELVDGRKKKKSKWKQTDLEDAIKAEKQKS